MPTKSWGIIYFNVVAAFNVGSLTTFIGRLRLG